MGDTQWTVGRITTVLHLVVQSFQNLYCLCDRLYCEFRCSWSSLPDNMSFPCISSSKSEPFLSQIILQPPSSFNCKKCAIIHASDSQICLLSPSDVKDHLKREIEPRAIVLPNGLLAYSTLTQIHLSQLHRKPWAIQNHCQATDPGHGIPKRVPAPTKDRLSLSPAGFSFCFGAQCTWIKPLEWIRIPDAFSTLQPHQCIFGWSI
jgi:hypothetical protein